MNPSNNPRGMSSRPRTVSGMAKLPRPLTAAARKQEAQSGVAQDDGSYPIPTRAYLQKAIHAYGRSKNPAKTKQHIIAPGRTAAQGQPI